MKLKKSYKGFVIWMIIFCVIAIGVCFLPINNAEIMTRIVNNICTLGVTFLTLIIYNTEYVYWYTGVSYEDAQRAGSERRKKFAWKHFKRFILFSLAFLIFSIIAQMFRVNIWIDILILVVGFVAVAFSTIRFKL